MLQVPSLAIVTNLASTSQLQASPPRSFSFPHFQAAALAAMAEQEGRPNPILKAAGECWCCKRCRRAR